MTIRELIKPNDPILRKECEKFDFADPPMDPRILYTDLAETMLHHEGLGLAAIQVGLPYFVFVIHSDPVRGFFNPEIVDESKEEVELEEGCLTYPGVLLKIPRPRKLRIRYSDAEQETTSETFDSLTSRVIQHEMMHCDGILFGEMVTRLQLEIAIRKANKRGFEYKIGDFL